MMSEAYAPHPTLHTYVKTLWRAERDFQPPHPTLALLPDSYIEVVFSFGAPCQIDDGHMLRDVPRSYIVGLLRKPLYLHAHGLVKTLGARFFAWGFFPLLGFAVGEPQHAVRQLNAMLQQLAEQIEQYVAQGDDAAALQHLHAFLIERALNTQFAQHEVAAAAQLLAHHGDVTIAQIADQCYLSRRQLERRFNTSIGVSPKALARTLRFEQARDRLWQEPDAQLAALADTCGYADQAHFTREFKQFSNRTPRQFAAEMRATRTLLQATDVAFVQDA